MVWSSWQQRRCQPGSWSYIQGLAPLSSSLPEQPVQDLGPQGKVSGGRSGRGASGEEGAQPACPWSWAAPHNTHRFTPIEPLHFPCVSGKSETGTEVLRKDKGGGRGRWPGFSACHKGQQRSGGGRTWGPGAHVPCARASEEPATAGRGQPGATRFPISLGREVAAPGRRNLSLAV